MVILMEYFNRFHNKYQRNGIFGVIMNTHKFGEHGLFAFCGRFDVTKSILMLLCIHFHRSTELSHLPVFDILTSLMYSITIHVSFYEIFPFSLFSSTVLPRFLFLSLMSSFFVSCAASFLLFFSSPPSHSHFWVISLWSLHLFPQSTSRLLLLISLPLLPSAMSKT